MAHWKRLTNVDGSGMDVNMDSVALLQPYESHTQIVFVGGRSDDKRILSVDVKETPDQIHQCMPISSL